LPVFVLAVEQLPLDVKGMRNCYNPIDTTPMVNIAAVKSADKDNLFSTFPQFITTSMITNY
jgi:hypothetical protein